MTLSHSKVQCLVLSQPSAPQTGLPAGSRYSLSLRTTSSLRSLHMAPSHVGMISHQMAPVLNPTIWLKFAALLGPKTGHCLHIASSPKMFTTPPPIRHGPTHRGRTNVIYKQMFPNNLSGPMMTWCWPWVNIFWPRDNTTLQPPHTPRIHFGMILSPKKAQMTPRVMLKTLLLGHCGPL